MISTRWRKIAWRGSCNPCSACLDSPAFGPHVKELLLSTVGIPKLRNVLRDIQVARVFLGSAKAPNLFLLIFAHTLHVHDGWCGAVRWLLWCCESLSRCRGLLQQRRSAHLIDRCFIFFKKRKSISNRDRQGTLSAWVPAACVLGGAAGGAVGAACGASGRLPSSWTASFDASACSSAGIECMLQPLKTIPEIR